MYRPRLTEREVIGHTKLCHICGWPVSYDLDPNHPLAATIDHVVPKAAGGPNWRCNRKVAHKICNGTKSHHCMSMKLAVDMYLAVRRLRRKAGLAVKNKPRNSALAYLRRCWPGFYIPDKGAE